MSILDYMSGKKVSEENKINSFKTKIFSLCVKNKIDNEEKEFLINFVTDNCPIVKTKYLHDNFKKINKKYGLFDAIKSICPNFVKDTDQLKELITEITKKKNNTWTDDQRKAIKEIIMTLYDSESSSYGLYGHAGTGKTHIIVEIVKYLLSKKLLTKIAMCAFTNNAIELIKLMSYWSSLKSAKNEKKNKEKEEIKTITETGDSENVVFLTLHKLLQFEADYDENGKKIFVKKKYNKKSCLQKYQLIICDECSMVSTSMRDEIKKDLDLNLGKNIPIKVIFLGDQLQLPPVSEKVSPLFSSSGENSMPQKIRIMTEVVRNKDKNVNGLCLDIRKWMKSPNNNLDIIKHASKKVKLNISKQKTIL